jgi:hypothetical protein
VFYLTVCRLRNDAAAMSGYRTQRLKLSSGDSTVGIVIRLRQLPVISRRTKIKPRGMSVRKFGVRFGFEKETFRVEAWQVSLLGLCAERSASCSERLSVRPSVRLSVCHRHVLPDVNVTLFPAWNSSFCTPSYFSRSVLWRKENKTDYKRISSNNNAF